MPASIRVTMPLRQDTPFNGRNNAIFQSLEFGWYLQNKDKIIDEMRLRMTGPHFYQRIHSQPQKQVPHLSEVTQDQFLDRKSLVEMFNKTAFLYLLRLVPTGEGIHGAPSDKLPITPEQWCGDADEAWKKCCQDEIDDGRYAFTTIYVDAPQASSLDKWIGLGEDTTLDPQQSNIDELISQHVDLCDRVSAESQNRCPLENLVQQGPFDMAPQPQEWDWQHHSSLAPTCRAVFMIGRRHMGSMEPVLLVLTGHNQDVTTGPLDFSTIPEQKVLRKISKDVVEVSLFTAVQYLHALQSSQELANAEFRQTNHSRRLALERYEMTMMTEATALYEMMKYQLLHRNFDTLNYSQVARDAVMAVWTKESRGIKDVTPSPTSPV